MEAKTMDHRIIILGDRKKVEPGAAIVAKADTLAWEAYDTDAWVIFSEDGCPFASSKIFVQSGKISGTLIVTGEPGKYPYSVYLIQKNSFAMGNSDPIIIIKR